MQGFEVSRTYCYTLCLPLLLGHLLSRSVLSKAFEVSYQLLSAIGANTYIFREIDKYLIKHTIVFVLAKPCLYDFVKATPPIESGLHVFRARNAFARYEASPEERIDGVCIHLL